MVVINGMKLVDVQFVFHASLPDNMVTMLDN